MSTHNQPFVKLNNGNYPEWKDKMQSWLQKQTVWGIVCEREKDPGPGEKQGEFWNKVDKAAGEIKLGLEDDQRGHYQGHGDDPVQIWKLLEAAHTSKKPVSRFIAYDDFFSIRKLSDESLTSTTVRLKDAMQKIKNLRPDKFTLDDLDDELMSMGMIRALPEEYSGFQSSLMLLDQLDTATLTEAFRNEEITRTRRAPATSTSDAVLSVSDASCTFCGYLGHMQDQCRAYAKAQQELKARRAKPKKFNSGNSGTSSGKANSAVTESAGNASLRSADPSLDDAHTHWNTDSGATSHMTPHREWLRNYTPYRVPIKLANNSIVYSEGVGSVVFEPRIGGKSAQLVELTRVLHVPALRNNLLAILFLTRQRNFNISINGDVMRFYHQRKLRFIASINDHNAAFLDGTTVSAPELANSASTLPLDISLWHRRLAHRNMADVQKLVREDLVDGMTIQSTAKPDPICEPCLAGKMHAHPFPSSEYRASKPLELIHSDVHGPVAVASHSGYKYWVTFTDDCLRFRCVIPLRKKSEAFEAFKRFKVWAEKSTGYKLLGLRDDKGGEYMSLLFQQFCDDEGITRFHTTRNRPQQGGVAERTNRILDEGVVTLLTEAGLPRSFWAEALAALVHTVNRCPTSTVTGGTPYQLWYNRKPSVDHIRVWGCLAYVHVQKDKRGSMGPHMEKCIFIGYPEGYKGWKFYNPVTKRTVISERADFDERYYPGLKHFQSDLSLPPYLVAPAPAADIEPGPNFVPPAEPDPVQDLGGDNVLAEPAEPIANPAPDPPADPAPAPAPAPPAEPVPIPDPAPAASPPRSPSPEPGPVNPPPTPPLAQRRTRRDPKPPTEWWKVQPPPPPVPAPHVPSDSEEDDDPEPDHALGSSTLPLPRSLTEAKRRPNGHLWLAAAQEEMNAHHANGTWKLVQLPPGKHAIGSSWVFKEKNDADGGLERLKMRLVARGDRQRFGIDYTEVFAPTSRMAAIRLILAIAAIEDLHLRSIDISHAFTHGELEEEIYMKQAEGFEEFGPEWVYLLLKSLYGLKQAARMWNKKLHETLVKIGFKRLQSDASIYIYVRDGVRIILPIFVDDITLATKSKATADAIVAELSSHFKLRDLGETAFLLGIKIIRDRSKRMITLCQRQYIVDTLDRYGLADCKPVTTPLDPGFSLTKAMGPTTAADIATMKRTPYLSAVGALMYLATTTRPDIAFAVGVLARFNADPGIQHWTAVKHLFRYVKGTMDLKLVYGPDPSSNELFTSFTDADHAGNKDNGRSTGGYLVRFGTGAISWSSKLQSLVALSTTEAEYIAAVEAGKEIMWMRHILGEFGYDVSKPSTLRVDNQSAISVAKNPEHHGRMKHMDLRFYWLRDSVEAGHIDPVFLPTAEMPADLLTKALPRAKVEVFREMMGLHT